MPKTENTDLAPETDPALSRTTASPQHFVRDSAVGARPTGHDHVLAPGCREPQRRPGGYMDY